MYLKSAFIILCLFTLRPENRGVREISVEMIEINTYTLNLGTAKEKSQVIFWEWSNSLPRRVKDQWGKVSHTVYDSGGYVVRDWRSIPDDKSHYFTPRYVKGSYYMTFYDPTSKLLLRIKSRYFIRTTTGYDREVHNRNILRQEYRTGLVSGKPR
jgi:hypothetical protein